MGFSHPFCGARADLVRTIIVRDHRGGRGTFGVFRNFPYVHWFTNCILRSKIRRQRQTKLFREIGEVHSWILLADEAPDRDSEPALRFRCPPRGFVRNRPQGQPQFEELSEVHFLKFLFVVQIRQLEKLPCCRGDWLRSSIPNGGCNPRKG